MIITLVESRNVVVSKKVGSLSKDDDDDDDDDGSETSLKEMNRVLLIASI